MNHSKEEAMSESNPVQGMEEAKLKVLKVWPDVVVRFGPEHRRNQWVGYRVKGGFERSIGLGNTEHECWYDITTSEAFAEDEAKVLEVTPPKAIQPEVPIDCCMGAAPNHECYISCGGAKPNPKAVESPQEIEFCGFEWGDECMCQKQEGHSGPCICGQCEKDPNGCAEFKPTPQEIEPKIDIRWCSKCYMQRACNRIPQGIFCGVCGTDCSAPKPTPQGEQSFENLCLNCDRSRNKHWERNDGFYCRTDGEEVFRGEWNAAQSLPKQELPKQLVSDEDIHFVVLITEGRVYKMATELQQWRKWAKESK